RRHTQTAVAALDAVGGDQYDIDPRWDEYDHVALTAHLTAAERPDDPREFQSPLAAAPESWVGGTSSDGHERVADFRGRVLAGLEDVVASTGSGQSSAVFTSGGPIAMVTSHLLAGDASLFITLNRVIVNASVTTVIVGRGGT